ncbi:hypothetical protein HDE_12475 [Halotydeus destructor]|nr:hypothetical protein HDE_12475 [Halotydeus destructor]
MTILTDESSRNDLMSFLSDIVNKSPELKRELTEAVSKLIENKLGNLATLLSQPEVKKYLVDMSSELLTRNAALVNDLKAAILEKVGVEIDSHKEDFEIKAMAFIESKFEDQEFLGKLSYGLASLIDLESLIDDRIRIIQSLQ